MNGKINGKILKITPKIAAELLRKNTANRKKNEKHIMFLSSQMSTGKWQMTYDPIRISVTDVLLDGQHRLEAVIKSGTTHDFFVIENCPDEMFQVLDTGKNRSTSDVLDIAGFTQSHNLAGLAKTIMAWNMNIHMAAGSYASVNKNHLSKENASGLSNAAILEFCRTNDIFPYLHFGTKLYEKNRFLSAREWSFYYYLFSQKSEQDANDFLTRLATGLELTETDPIYLLRLKLEYSRNSPSLRLAPRAKIVFIIKAWRLYRRSESVKRLMYSPDEKIPEVI